MVVYVGLPCRGRIGFTIERRRCTNALPDGCRFNGARTVFAEPGSSSQNAWVESFNGRVCDESLNGELCHTARCWNRH